MTTVTLRRWAFIHKWTSLACTVFLLLFCLTGLPLVFKDELRALSSDDPPYAVLPADAPRVSLDTVIEAARRQRPGHLVWFVFVDDEPKITVAMVPSPTALPAQAWRLSFDARTGALVKEVEPAERRSIDFLDLMLRLHRDLFAELPGELFLGFMGLLFVASLVSGAVLYGPFMRRLDFGAVRQGRSRRIKWLDLHNLLSIVTLAWALMVGATGVMNELSRPLFQLFQRTDVQAMLQPYRGLRVPAQDELVSLQAAYERAQLPGRTAVSIVFPSSRIGSPHHYLVWTKGSSPLTARLFTPVLVDAQSGALTAVVQLPWYLRAIQVSRPLHFGDYGGLPLKIIWALLDLVTIAVLGSGLFLWLSRRGSSIERRLAELETLANDA